MSPRLDEINRSLRALDEAHRLGRITRADYRARRRHLLGTLVDGGGITARNTVDAKTVPRARTQTVPAAPASRDVAMSAMFPSWWSRLLHWKGWFSGRR